MNSANLAFFALLFLLSANGTISSTQALLIAALLTTGSCVCNNQNNSDLRNLNLGGTVST